MGVEYENVYNACCCAYMGQAGVRAGPLRVAVSHVADVVDAIQIVLALFIV